MSHERPVPPQDEHEKWFIEEFGISFRQATQLAELPNELGDRWRRIFVYIAELVERSDMSAENPVTQPDEKVAIEAVKPSSDCPNSCLFIDKGFQEHREDGSAYDVCGKDCHVHTEAKDFKGPEETVAQTPVIVYQHKS